MTAEPAAGRDAYFAGLQAALHAAGVVAPTLVIDRERLDGNIDLVREHLPPGMGLRVVVKSLPCPPLVERVCARVPTQRLMTFNLAMLLDFAAAMPEADQLLGKPLPVAAARRFIASVADAPTRLRKVQWLVDTPARLREYAGLAEAEAVELRINLELDIGLHRGGFVPGPELDAALRSLTDAKRLRLAGFMGYEPHVARLPVALGLRRRARDRAWRCYAAANEAARRLLGSDTFAGLTRNAAGSPTYRLYGDTAIANEVAVGSALVKPTDFDSDLLARHRPALFIAAPVLKVLDRVRVPGLDGSAGAWARLGGPRSQAVFIHGGHWLAQPVDPPRLRYSPVFGRSSNQELLHYRNRNRGLPALRPDDFVFLRPTQSEAVMLQFGAIAVVEAGAVVERWPVLSASA